MNFSSNLAARAVLPIPAIPGTKIELDLESRSAAILSSSFSLPKKRLVLGISLRNETNCFSMCFDKSLSIKSGDNEDRSTEPLSSIYLNISTCLNGRSDISTASDR